MIARSWQGFAARWSGAKSISAVRELADIAVPVIQVGMDACDGGGMVLVQLGTLGAGQRMQGVFSSALGFVVYGMRVRVGAAGAHSVVLVLLDAVAAIGAAGTIAVSQPLRDVQVSCTGEPAVAPASWPRLPIEGASAVQVVRLARPIVVPPNKNLVVGSGLLAGTQELALFLEEGM